MNANIKNPAKQFSFLNVASSTLFLDDFINLDKSIYIKLARLYPLIKYFVGNKYKDQIFKYKNALQEGILIEHDCRKPLPFPNFAVDHILCSHFLEHVYPDEALTILKDFNRVLKNDGTIHLILPDMKILIDNYLNNTSAVACDSLIENTLLTKPKRPSFRYRILELFGHFGLQHYWMYDLKSMNKRIIDTGFHLIEGESIPTREFRKDDKISFHLFAKKCK
jgi:predicted SAM-dependent methyltransferase